MPLAIARVRAAASGARQSGSITGLEVVLASGRTGEPVLGLMSTVLIRAAEGYE